MSVRYPITVEAQVQDWSKGKTHLLPSEDEENVFELFHTKKGEAPMLVAKCANPKFLSEWALVKGASAVDFDFDLGAYEATR